MLTTVFQFMPITKSDGFVITLRPNANGDLNTWTAVGDDENWKCVDDVISDDDATYVLSPASSEGAFNERYNLENSSASGAISSIEVFMYVYEWWEEPCPDTLFIGIISNGSSNFSGTLSGQNGVWTLISFVWNNNPFTLNPWTWNEINDLVIGWAYTNYIVDPLTYLEVTQTYIEVHESFSGNGSGTAEDPYQITNCDELNQTRGDLSAYYILMNDIDLSDCGVESWNEGKGFVPISNGDAYFTGSFDGQNHTISNLYMNENWQLKAPFGQIDTDGVVKNLGLVNVNISGEEYSAGLAGYNGGTITNCYSTGTVIGHYNTGGLVGTNDGTITNCYSTANVTGMIWDIGGLVAINGGTISDCYATGDVTGNERVGGLIGLNTYGIVTNCYSTGNVDGDIDVGGLVGYGGTVTNSYWDNETSGQTTSDGGEGRTTAQMTYPYEGYDPPCTGLYEDWDLDYYENESSNSIWVHDDPQNDGYPLFRTDYISPLSLTWTEVIDHTPWGARVYSGSMVYDNKMWVMGGTASGNVFNDTWYTTDGRLWNRATPNADWITRYAFGSVAYDNKMWVMGGQLWTMGGEWLDNDVWYSTDGANWTQVTASANWTPRSTFTTLVYDDKMWVIGGWDDGTGYLNDVWYTTDGIDWTQATANANFFARTWATSQVYDNKMWVIGGQTLGPTPLNDTWYSTNGADWTEATANAGWVARYGHDSVVYNDMLWVLGGTNGVDSYNDTWYSSDGVTWTETSELAEWYERYYLQALAYNNETYVFSGINGDYRGDVWYTGPEMVTGDNMTFVPKMITPQYPYPHGWDLGFNTWGQPIMADDWQASENSYVTGIHFWISYYNDNYIDIPSVDVAIWSNNAGYPSVRLWNDTFTDFNISGPYYGDEGFAINDWYGEHNHVTFYRIDIENIPEPFVQFNGSTYWLALTTPWFGDPYFPGWKTTTNISLSPAVYGPADGWFRMYDPLTFDPLSLAFVITGEPMELGDQTQFPDAKMETIQEPNATGWDMWYNWWLYGYLADDWNCMETTQVTGIHFWVSWYSDIVSEIPWINVSIESDAPGQPNEILWSREFATEDFTVTGPYYGDEGFAFAGDSYFEHNHQKFWRINIENITEPFLQENGTTYWLALKLPVDLYVGWKTSLNDTLSSAMYGGIEGWYPINNPTPPYEQFDFSFVITGQLEPWELTNGWNEYPDNPIYGATLGNGTAYYPCVIKDENLFSGNGDASLYKMWYYTGSGTKLVYSDDGIHWSSPAISMVNVTDCYHAVVVYEEDGFGNGYHYRMDWITNPGGTTDISVMKYAWSNDGINWEGTTSLTQSIDNVSMRICNDISGYFWQTCGVAQTFYNPTATNPGWGTIDDISDDGSPWDYSWVISFNPTRNQEHSGLAYSGNGTYFIRFGGDYPILIANGSGWDSNYSYGTSIVHNANGFVGWYTGGVDSQYHQGIGFAYSSDGLTWTKDADNPVFHISDGIAYRSARTYTPWVIKDGNYYKMWFTGQNGAGQKNICYAIFSSLTPIAYNETLINGTAYTTIYNSMLSVTVSGYNPPLSVIFKYGNGTAITTISPVDNESTAFCNLSMFHHPHQWLSHDTTYSWYVTVSDIYDYSIDSPTWWFHTSKAWDCDENQDVNYLDVSILVSNYGTSGYIPGEIPADIVEDGVVNYLDVSSLVSHYGESY